MKKCIARSRTEPLRESMPRDKPNMKDCTHRRANIKIQVLGHPNVKALDKAISELNKLKSEYEESCQSEEIDFEPKRGKKGKRLKDWEYG